MAFFDNTTIGAAVDTGPRALRTDVDKIFLDALFLDAAKGLFSTVGNTFPELHWDTSRIAYTWAAGGGASAPTAFLQRASATKLELKDAPNTGFIDLDVNNLAIQATKKLFLDGVTENSYLIESATDVVDLFTGGVKALTIDANQDLNLQNHALLNVDWANSDDGSGSALDADTVDGQHAADLSPATLNAIGNVTITSIATGEVIKWSGSAWINNTLAELLAGATLDDIGDVTVTSIGTGELLKWNGSAWINNTLAEVGVAAASHNHSANDINADTMADARIALSNISQHTAQTKVLDYDDGQHATTAVTTEEIVHQYTLPGGTLATDGDWLYLTMWGTMAANNNDKSVLIDFGGSQALHIDWTGSGSGAAQWAVSVKVIRSGSGTVIITAGHANHNKSNFGPQNASQDFYFEDRTEAIGSNVVIAFALENQVAAAADIVYEGSMVIGYIQ